jgi:hypothetical protein
MTDGEIAQGAKKMPFSAKNILRQQIGRNLGIM